MTVSGEQRSADQDFVDGKGCHGHALIMELPISPLFLAWEKAARCAWVINSYCMLGFADMLSYPGFRIAESE